MRNADYVKLYFRWAALLDTTFTGWSCCWPCDRSCSMWSRLYGNPMGRTPNKRPSIMSLNHHSKHCECTARLHIGNPRIVLIVARA